MIHQVSGDILLTNAQVIAHGVAPNDDFHVGLALALREQWPALYKDFRHFFHQQHPETGGLWMWGGTGGLRIVNLFTQEPAGQTGGHPGKASTENVNHALRALHKLAEKEQFTSIALPRLATGVGGLDWAEVEPLIEHHLGSLHIPVVVYTNYVAAQKAEEPVTAHRV
jgi:O-acetyl-ADP-ribose deacetylase (regulator of RNase III)